MTSASRSHARRRWLTALVLGASLGVLPSRSARAEQPDAQTRTAARELALEGAAAFEQQEYAAALDRFNRAFAVFPAPSIAIMQARSLARLRRLVEALDKYEETRRMRIAADAPAAFRQAVEDAAREAEELRAQIPRLTVKLEGSAAELENAQLTLDGKPIKKALWGVALPVDPGSHQIAATHAGRAPVRREVAVSEGGASIVELELSPAPARTETHVEAQEPSSTRRVLGWSGIGLGAAGVATGTITGVLALGLKSDLDAVCRPGCPASARGDIDAFRSRRTLSYVGFGVGAAALAAGAYLLLSGDESSTHVGALVTPRSASFLGAF